MKPGKSAPNNQSWDLQSNDKLITLAREHDFSECVDAFDAPGPFWIAGLCEIHGGSVEYLLGDGTSIFAPQQYFVFIPPYSLVKMRLNGTRQTIRAMLSRTKEPPVASEQAFLLEADSGVPSAEGTRQCIEHCVAPSALALRCKSIIDQNYCTPMQIKSIASQLRTSSTSMGRYFKRDYALSPIQYRNYLRVLDAAMKLSEDQSISKVFLDVGFEDLSRFYKIFKSIATVPPGEFRPQKSRKTPR